MYIFTSCSKPGLGGEATLFVHLMHHTAPVPGLLTWPDTVFIKFGAKSFPGTQAADYDTYFTSVTGSNIVSCTNLRWGHYYLYGVGYDSACFCRVTGGMAVKILRSDRKDQIDLNLAVTE